MQTSLAGDAEGRPRLLGPVLRRPRGVQVGVDPPGAVLLEVAEPEPLARLLDLLDGTRTWAEIAPHEASAGAAPDWWVLVEDLAARGLLVHDPASGGATAGRLGAAARWVGTRIRLVGAGPVAVAVAAQLAAAGVGTLVLHDEHPHLAEPPAGHDLGRRPDAGAATRAQRLRARLAADHPATRVQVVNHWSKPEQGCDLTVVVGDTLEHDRGMTDTLLRADQTHLLVRPGEGGPVVGPAVRPGRSACLRCLDLARRDRDPDWPALVRQLSRRYAPVGALARDWAAVTTSTQALALVAGGSPDTVGGTLELDEADLVVRTRRWPAHPSCGCHWGQAAEWGP